MRRRWLFWLLVIAFAVWLVASRTEVGKLAETLAQGKWQWVLLAAALQLGHYVAFALMVQCAFQTVGVRSHLTELVPVTFASLFVNVAAPVGGASGVALFVDDAARRGQSGARASAGTVLMLVSQYTAFALVLACGMVYLFWRRGLAAYQIAGAAALVLLVIGLSAVLLLGLWRPVHLHRSLEWVQRTANRLAGWLRRPAFLAEGWAARNAAEFTQAANAIAASPRGVVRTIGAALSMHLVHMASLFALFPAFYEPVQMGVGVAGFALGTLFWIVAITPQGIGVVEGVMVLVLSSLGVPPAQATVIALAFRGLGFWLPLSIGFLVLRRVKSFHDVKPTELEKQIP
jgi:uncharacterized protein (TIRG00374 family)